MFAAYSVFRLMRDVEQTGRPSAKHRTQLAHVKRYMGFLVVVALLEIGYLLVDHWQQARELRTSMDARNCRDGLSQLVHGDLAVGKAPSQGELQAVAQVCEGVLSELAGDGR